jgi:hypothetical protein
MYHSNQLRNILFQLIDEESKDPQNLRNPRIDFSRNRKLSFAETFKIILSMGGNTLDTELLNHFRFDCRLPTSSAFVQSRSKILPTAFINVFHQFNKKIDSSKHFNGYRLLAVDGTNLNLFRNPNDTDSFVAQKNSRGHNLLTLSTIFDLLNNIYLDAEVQPANMKDERGALIQMFPSIPSKSIIIADRGYESYNLFAHLEEMNQNYLFRVKDINSNGILSGLDLPENEFDERVTINISNKQKKAYKQLENFRFSPTVARFDFSTDENPVYTLAFRVTRVKLENGKYEALISNLPEDFTSDDIKNLYALRWGIETSFRELKYAVGLNNIHAKKKDSVMQEIYARLTLYNYCKSVTNNIILPKASRNSTYKINFTKAVRICREYFRSQNTVHFNVEALVSKFLSIVRPDRAYKRTMKPKRFTSFTYRIA